MDDDDWRHPQTMTRSYRSLAYLNSNLLIHYWFLPLACFLRKLHMPSFMLLSGHCWDHEIPYSHSSYDTWQSRFMAPITKKTSLKHRLTSKYPLITDMHTLTPGKGVQSPTIGFFLRSVHLKICGIFHN
ncbi:hypothetical protein J6590_009007 [Homalodisca vitripennis]|nr:hypothetical protein J6590_009007 [Homalodisca vitripennis]